MNIENSDYIIYVDESGDHGLKNIDTDYPIFVLSFCCFLIEDYVDVAVPKLQKLKFKYFGHDQVIFHEHHIRKQKGGFSFLRKNRDLRTGFLEDVAEFIQNLPFVIVSVVIDKSKLSRQYTQPFNPYHLSIRFGLERLLDFLIDKGQKGKRIQIIFEKRGLNEDKQLELEFRRICDDNKQFGYKQLNFGLVKFRSVFADKKSNSCGLQIADLTARPIGLNYLRPDQTNRAYEIIKEKIYRNKHFP